MAKTMAQKIAAAKAKPASLKKTKEIEVVSKAALSKANKLIVKAAEKNKATKRNTGAYENSTMPRDKNIKYTYEKGLEKAAKTAIKQGRSGDVQRIRASQAVDASKTAMRAKIFESHLKNKKSK